MNRHQTALNWLINLPIGKTQKLTSEQKLIIIDIWDSSIGIPFEPSESHDWYINCAENLETVTKHPLR